MIPAQEPSSTRTGRRPLTRRSCRGILAGLAGLTILLCAPGPLPARSQPVPGTAGQEAGTHTDPVEEQAEPSRPLVSPARAAMLSASLPGLGQVYNRKYWKIPIIYAGFGTLAYFVNMNNTEYQKWRSAYIARVDGNPNTVDGFPLHSTDVLQRAMNYYRRNLEVTYLLGVALYILNILDANVDAHLMDFDVREDLSLRLQPMGGHPGLPAGTTPAGLTFTINF